MMNKFYLVLSVVVSIIFVGCSNSEELNVSKSYVSTDEAKMLAFEYLELQDGVYVLNLSEEQAKDLAISPTDYSRIKIDVSETNKAIKESNSMGNASLSLLDPQDIDLNFARVSIKTRGESTPNGAGSLYDDQYVTISVRVPQNCSSVTFNMYSNSLIGVGSAALYYGGQVYSSGSCFSSFASGSGSCSLNVPMGGETYTVVLRVSSSFGGSYYYNYN